MLKSVVVVVASPRAPLWCCPDRTAGAPGTRDSIHPVPHPQSVCVMYGPLDDGGIPEECHSFLRALPEVLHCMYVVKLPVYL